jgi:CrcB protein
MTVLYVALGGAIGSAGRYLLGAYIARFVTPVSPLSTFTVNVSGCFLFGVLAALAERRFVMQPAGRAFLLIGLLGGFTTFSSYTYETFELLREGMVLRALAHAIGQVVSCLIALWVGFALVRSL